MTAAISRELILQKDYLNGETVNTVYFGGGTPSLLAVDEVDSLLATVANNFALAPDAEITLEANPDDLTEDLLSGLRQSGINRLSIGIQSFSDNILRLLNRCHDSRTAIDAYRRSRQAGFENINIDLIYAIPGLGGGEWEENIRQTIAMEPEHISAYTLTIEPKTVFGRLAARGKFREVDEDTAAVQMELLIDLLTTAGYDQYEVSNFSKPGLQSRHNRSYWRQDNYLGAGPGAHSFNGASRQSNVTNNHAYVKAIAQDRVPFQLEMLSKSEQINEYVLTSLRMRNGCDLKALQSKYDFDLLANKSSYLNQLVGHDLAALNDSVLQLTRKGMLLADKIATDLFV